MLPYMAYIRIRHGIFYAQFGNPKEDPSTRAAASGTPHARDPCGFYTKRCSRQVCRLGTVLARKEGCYVHVVLLKACPQILMSNMLSLILLTRGSIFLTIYYADCWIKIYPSSAMWIDWRGQPCQAQPWVKTSTQRKLPLKKYASWSPRVSYRLEPRSPHVPTLSCVTPLGAFFLIEFVAKYGWVRGFFRNWNL